MAAMLWQAWQLHYGSYAMAARLWQLRYGSYASAATLWQLRYGFLKEGKGQQQSFLPA